MNIFCTENFKKEFDKLISKNTYSKIENLLIDFFFIKNNYTEGTHLNPNKTPLLIKKRIGASGGFRVYFYVYIQNNKLYLTHTHPKTGKFGQPNIDADLLKNLLKKLIKSVKDEKIYTVTHDDKTKKLIFKINDLSDSSAPQPLSKET